MSNVTPINGHGPSIAASPEEIREAAMAADPAQVVNFLREIPQNQLVVVVNSGFSERFMGAQRVRNPSGGYRWKNTHTGVTGDPFDVTTSDALMLDALRRFCAADSHQLAWTLEEVRGMVHCMIGRPVGTAGAPSDVIPLAAVATPQLGASIAVAMLHVTGFDFEKVRRELYDDAPRINLDT